MILELCPHCVLGPLEVDGNSSAKSQEDRAIY